MATSSLIWHPFTQMKSASPPLSIAYGKGLYLYSEKGVRYMDAISSWWVNLHGHAHPYIVEKLHQQATQLEQVIFAGCTHAPARTLAERLTQLIPGSFSKIFYSDNGSTAVEVALKIALQYWYNQGIEKKKILCFKNSYHGDTFGAMSAAGRNGFNRPFWSYLFDVVTIDPPRRGEEESSLLQAEALLRSEEFACFIFEPLVLGAGGMIFYPPEGLTKIIRLCKRYKTLTIADEVLTGFGRTSTLFAIEQLGETPDLIALSKGLTGGFLPLGATLCHEKIYEAFLGDHLQQAFLHGHSYTANPLACSCALASLDLLLEESCFQRREKIAEAHQIFCDKWREHPRLKRCESIGTILALEYRTKEASYFHPLREQLYPYFLSKGILLRPIGNVLYLIPPYCIEREELSYIYHHIEMTLEGGI